MQAGAALQVPPPPDLTAFRIAEQGEILAAGREYREENKQDIEYDTEDRINTGAKYDCKKDRIYGTIIIRFTDVISGNFACDSTFCPAEIVRHIF